MNVMQGTLDVLVLRSLRAGPQHGYGIASWIRQCTDGDLEIEDGALYQALHRLEHRGVVQAAWGVTDNNRRARYYKLTARGRRELRASEASWRRYAKAVFRVLDSEA
jgi:PadR family transcriptional regulator PadR